MKKNKIFAANWKMNLLASEASEFAAEFLKTYVPDGKKNVIVFPQLPLLGLCLSLFEGQGVSVGSQNHGSNASGAFTGETSPALVKELGCEHALVGHSERRQLFGEDDGLCAAKVRIALEQGLKPMLCVGETKEERDSGKLEELVSVQVRRVFETLNKEEASRCSVAYEPIWAIGTGETATSEDADQAGKIIRGVLSEIIGESLAGEVPVLYGGSANPGNSAGLLSRENVDGLLIGGASLKPASFLSIINSI